MATNLSEIEAIVRRRLIEPKPKFWSSAELLEIVNAGIKDLWRATVDLKGEHYLKRDNTSVTFPANTTALSGVPQDVHKIYLLEPVNMGDNGANRGLIFKPLEYNHPFFSSARAKAAISPTNDVIYYAIGGEGGPVNAPTIYAAPQVNSAVAVSFAYIPTLGALAGSDPVPIPGEADNALVAWTVAYARAKEREDRSPDSNWLAIYGTEKQNLLQSLGLRQYQEPATAQAMFEEFWP